MKSPAISLYDASAGSGKTSTMVAKAAWAVHRGIGVVRPTNDVDIVLHIETARGVPNAVAGSLERLGYRLVPAVDPRDNHAHRWLRDDQVLDVAIVDVVTADHAAPSVVERMRGRDMVAIEGGTQALRRTVNASLDIEGSSTVVSVPSPLGAMVLKAAAYLHDSRDRQRHLYDAAALLARQRAFAVPPGLVADGRDMGTVVFPAAGLKVFLTASAEERARRRYNQLKDKGLAANLAGLSQEILERDRRDSARSVAPLRPAADAVVIDSTGLTVDDVVDRILVLAREAFPAM